MRGRRSKSGPVEAADVAHARTLHHRHPESGRSAVPACRQRRGCHADQDVRPHTGQRILTATSVGERPQLCRPLLTRVVVQTRRGEPRTPGTRRQRIRTSPWSSAIAYSELPPPTISDVQCQIATCLATRNAIRSGIGFLAGLPKPSPQPTSCGAIGHHLNRITMQRVDHLLADLRGIAFDRPSAGRRSAVELGLPGGYQCRYSRPCRTGWQSTFALADPSGVRPGPPSAAPNRHRGDAVHLVVKPDPVPPPPESDRGGGQPAAQLGEGGVAGTGKRA